MCGIYIPKVKLNVQTLPVNGDETALGVSYVSHISMHVMVTSVWVNGLQGDN